MAELFLVTGGAGFIGSHLANRLVALGQRVRVADNLATGKRERLAPLVGAIEFLEGDLADRRFCGEAVRGVDYILHQAAIPSVQRSLEDPVTTHHANVTATLNLLESARQHGVRRFVYAASSSAYGDSEVLPKKENMVPNPLSPYALQKLTGESYCALYYRLFGIETVSLRYFNIFGPGQDPDSEYSAVIPKFVYRLLSGEPLIVYGDGEQSRDFTYIDNVVEANLCALGAPAVAGKVFNIGCGERVTLNRLIELLQRITGLKADVHYAAPRPGDVRHSLADLDSAAAELGYRPTVGFEEGLSRTVAAMRQAVAR
jgi:nucleoside-diphosphate-sugar epimerase